MSPRPSRAAMNDYYPDTYGGHVVPPPSVLWHFVDHVKAAKGRYPSSPRWHRAALGRSLGWVNLLDVPFIAEGTRLVELGSGGGRNLRWATSYGWEAVGVEPSLSAANRAGHSLVGAAEAVPLRASTADTVLMCHSLEHCFTPSVALAEANRLLRPGGRLVIVVPNCDCAAVRLLGSGWHHLDLPRHLWHFDRPSLCNAVHRSGFEIERVKLTSWPIALGRTIRQRLRLGLRNAAGGPVFRARGLTLGDCIMLHATRTATARAS